MELLRKAQRITTTSFDLVFISPSEMYSGYAFPCTEQGEVLPLPEVATENYIKCLKGEHDVLSGEVRKSEHSYTECAIGKCLCGLKVMLSAFTNECDKCGRDYNMAGQLLAPRSQWGEETGEQWMTPEEPREDWIWGP